MAQLAHRIDKPGKKIDLGEIDSDHKGGVTREEADGRFAKLAAELEELQELLYAAGENSLLVVLQGRDTAGKDGTLKAVGGAMNPVGVRIASFKVPNELEAAHDFLWRVHAQAPRRGEVTFFNRSHYEDVLVVRVHELVPEKVWKRRYDHINAFEDLLADSGTIVVKFYLHISKGEQERRLLDREAEPKKAWKLSPGDWQERELWDDYTKAYEDALSKCASERAPWYVVPADQKWYRNVAVAEVLVETLRPYRAGWEAKLAAFGEEQKAALAALRAKGGAK